MHSCCCLSRDATAAPRTRHAQFLLPVSRRSGPDHATTRLVSHGQTKRKNTHTHIFTHKLDPCKQGAITLLSPHIGCTVTPSELGTPTGGRPRRGGLPPALPAIMLRLEPHRSSVCPAHVKHITAYVPLHNHMAAQPPIKARWAHLSLSHTHAHEALLKICFTSYFFFYMVAVSALHFSFFLPSSFVLPNYLCVCQHHVC